MNEKMRWGVWVSGVVGGLYFLLAWTSPEMYPVSTFPMYAQSAHFPVERLLILDSDAKALPNHSLPSLLCGWPLGAEESRGKALRVGSDGETYHIPYLDQEVENRVEWGAPSEVSSPDFSLVRRRFYRSGLGEITTEDIPVAFCRGRNP